MKTILLIEDNEDIKKGLDYLFMQNEYLLLHAKNLSMAKKYIVEKKYDLILVPADGFGCPGYFRMAYCIDTEKVKRSIPVLKRFVQEVYR